MNHIYRIVWNSSKHIWQVVSELGSTRCKSSSARSRRRRRLALLAVAALGAGAQAADVLPAGGHVVTGQATLNYAGKTLTIQQGSNKAAIDWSGFSIGQGATVAFVQPSASAVALNRVLGTDPSIIQGALNANGHVFLLNPNGVLFSPTAQVDVGGLLASTLAMSNADFMAGTYHLSGTSVQAVENQGRIQAAAGGNVALVAARVVNAGEIAAERGNVLLGAGADAVVDFGGPVKLQVNKGALDALVDNGGAIRADGGTVLLTAKSAGELSASVINNSGIVQARTLATGAQGRILLLGDMQTGTANVGGTLDASAPAGGNGGAIETSAAHVQTAPGLIVNAGAAAGKGGEWLIDPFDYVIAGPGAATIANTLNQGTSVTVTTQQAPDPVYGPSTPGLGDITVTSPIAKTSGGDATLTLRADRNVVVGADITSTSGKLNMALSAANAVGATSGGVDVNGNLKSNGGDILIGGGTGSTTGGIGYARNLSGTGAAVTVETAKSILSTGGNITINGKSTVGTSSGSYDGTTAGVYIKSDATILSGTGNLLINGESAGGTNTFGIGFEAAANTVTTVGSAPGGGTMLLSAVNSTPGGHTADELAQGAIGLTSDGSRDRIAFQGPSVAAWLVYVNGAPQLPAYTQAPQLSSCAAPYPNCGVLVVPGSNNSYLYATYQAVDMSTAPLYMINAGNGSKVYDGSAVATGLTLTTLGGPNGFTPGSLTPAPVFLTPGKDVDTYGTLTADAGNPAAYTSDGTRYAIGYFNTGTYAITPKALTISGLGAANKTYDGTTAATLTGGSLVGLVGTETLNLSGLAGTFADKNVGVGKTVTISGGTLADGTGHAANYSLTAPPSATATITAKTLNVAGITAADKVYDGTRAATVSRAGATVGGVVAGDDVGLSASGTFADKNVGSGKTVALSTSLSGQDAGNYTLAGQSSATASITPKALTMSGITAADKVYDGTTTTTLSAAHAQWSGLLANDFVFATTTGRFANKDAGSAKTVTLTTTYGGADVGNYAITSQSSTTATIMKKAATVSGITAADKTYDGTTAATVSTAPAVVQGLVTGDQVSVASTGRFADKNVGNAKTVTLSNTYGGADAGNYAITGQSSATAAITQQVIIEWGITASNKTYDGTTAATVSTAGAVLGGLVAGDDVHASATGRFADKNAGSAKTVTLSNTFSGADVGNYLILGQPSATASIMKKAVTVSGITAADKRYDGTTAATVSTAGAVVQGLVAGDDVHVTSTGTFLDKNVALWKLVPLTNTYSGADVGNYAITGQSWTGAAITKLVVVAWGVTAADKVYDGTTAATVSTAGAVMQGLIAGDDVRMTSTGTFADKNAGSAKTVTLSNTFSGADVGNYLIVGQPSATAAITKKAVTVSGITAADKVYDGTTAATVSTAGAVVQGLVAGDQVNVTSTGAFADRNAGSAKTVTLASTYGGADVGNYAITGQSSATASITPKPLTVSGITAEDKVYDGTTAATVSVAHAQLSGLVAGDDVTLGASGSFADPNAGTGKTVALASTHGGADLGNYAIADQASATAAITPKALTLTGLAAVDKVYDGTTAATLAGGQLVGLVGTETLGVTGLAATFADKNVGSGKTVAISGGALADGTGLAANYSLAVPASATASITPKALTVSGITAADKVYDGTTAATVSSANAVLGGLVEGDSVTVAAQGTFADKNAGSGKIVNLAGTVGGADAGNYATDMQRTATASIAQKTVTVTGAAVADKTADGTTAATLTTAGTLAGTIAGDSVAVSAAGANARFAQATPGTGIDVDVSGLALTGPEASNYAFTGQTATTGTIFAAATQVSATSPAPAPAPEPARAPAPASAPASVAATTIGPQALGFAPVLPAPAVVGSADLAVPDAAVATTVPAADGQGAEAGDGATDVSATNRRQTSSQALSAGRDVGFLNVRVLSGGIRMPAAGSGETVGMEAPNL